MVALLVAVWRLSGGGWILLAGIAATVAALVYQHAIVRPGDLSRVDAAFFTANGFVSVVLAALRNRRSLVAVSVDSFEPVTDTEIR